MTSAAQSYAQQGRVDNNTQVAQVVAGLALAGNRRIYKIKNEQSTSSNRDYASKLAHTKEWNRDCASKPPKTRDSDSIMTQWLWYFGCS